LPNLKQGGARRGGASLDIKIATWLYRREVSDGPDGKRVVIHYRRRAEAVDGDKVRVGGIEQCVVSQGEPLTSWMPTGGLLGMPTTTALE
jgi:hypothetical protein